MKKTYNVTIGTDEVNVSCFQVECASLKDAKNAAQRNKRLERLKGKTKVYLHHENN